MGRLTVDWIGGLGLCVSYAIDDRCLGSIIYRSHGYDRSFTRGGLCFDLRRSLLDGAD